MTLPFIHLRCHSAYSLAKGAMHPKNLVALARDAKMPAVGLTDAGNLFGVMEFARYATESNVQPIVGCELQVKFEDAQLGADDTYYTVVLYAQNEAGYLNLLKLVSDSFLQTEAGETSHIDIEQLQEHGANLIALSGGHLGALNQPIINGQLEQAKKHCEILNNAFEGRFYIELQRHDNVDENQAEPELLKLADELNIPLVATNNVYFDVSGMFSAHEVLQCIAASKTINDPTRPKSSAHYYFKSDEDMRELFKDIPEAIQNTSIIAQRCAYMPEFRKPLLPAFESDKPEAEELADQAKQGLLKRLKEQVLEDSDDENSDAAKPYLERLDYELSVINQMGFAGYFLIVADFIKWSKDNDIPVGPGRGSGAGSVVAWALTITDLDPLRFGLLFERFLNPERVSMPDFDIDFCQDRRDEVIQYVQNKYGADTVAQIITFGKLQARAVVRDVGRVLAMPYGQVDRIAKLIPNNPAAPVTLQEAIDIEQQLQDMRAEEDVDRLITIALQLEGLYRHASTHAAGVVIGDRPLNQLIPLYRDPRSTMPVTQFHMKDVEAAGLVKFDFLGLKTLTVLSETCHLLKARGVEIDLTNLPLDNKDTYDMLGRGETVGVFQLESAGMRDVLVKLKPDRFEDIIAVVALYRPGPMDNIPSYINCKHGVETPDYLHPVLEPILTETFGIMIYQEQVMQAAQLLSGYTLGGADLLRRAMGKKIKAEMDAQQKAFVEGAVKNKVDAKKAEQIFEQVAKFAGYGFNKSHAAAYALVAYQTAYLKANYPHEFMAATMTLDKGNTDKLSIFKQELDRLKIEMRPPDINASNVDFKVENEAIYYALSALKGVGEVAMSHLIKEREENGPFQSLVDFARRVDVKSINKRMLESLAKAGSFDSLEPNRAKVLGNAEYLLKIAHTVTDEKNNQQAGLFGDFGSSDQDDIKLQEAAPWPALEKLREEFEAVGFYLSSHPLDSYKSVLDQLHVVPSAQLLEHLQTRSSVGRVTMAGVLIAKKERRSAKGNKYAFLTLSDSSGVYEITCFSEILLRCRDFLDVGTSLLVRCDAMLEDDGLRLTAGDIELLEGKNLNLKEISLTCDSSAISLDHLKSMVAALPKGRGIIRLSMQLEDQNVHLELPDKYELNPALQADFEEIPGVTSVNSVF